MLAVPKRKTSKARSSRRSSSKKNPPSLVECPQCHELKSPHYICPTCGYYKGKQVLKTE